MKNNLKNFARTLIGRRGGYFHYRKGAVRSRKWRPVQCAALIVIAFVVGVTSVGPGMMGVVASHFSDKLFGGEKPLAANAKPTTDPAQVEAVRSFDEQKLTQATKDELVAAQEEKRAQPDAREDRAQPDAAKVSPEQRERVGEDVSKRTEFSTEYINRDGSRTLAQSMTDPLHYQQNGQWQKIVPKAQKDDAYQSSRPSVSARATDFLANAVPKLQTETPAYDLSAGNLQSKVKPLADGVTLTKDGRNFSLTPQNVRNVKPRTVQLADGTPRVIYEDAWPGVDVFYTLKGSELKEEIILKNSSVATSFSFKIAGGNVSTHPTQPGALLLQNGDTKFTIPAPTVATFTSGVLGGEHVRQTLSGDTITIEVNQNWLRAQPVEAFPVIVDPTLTTTTSDYQSLKGDGTVCWPGQGCGQSAGKMQDGVGTIWRFRYKANYDSLEGKAVTSAQLQLRMYDWDGVHNYGTEDSRTFWARAMPAGCDSFTCVDTSFGEGVTSIGFGGYLDMTDLFRNMVNGNAFGRPIRVQGEENNNNLTFKMFDPGYTVLYVDYYTPSPAATPASDTLGDGASIVTPQPELKVNQATDPLGRDVHYFFRIATGRDGESNAVANSGWQKGINKWTVPDGVLQDGVTYYWRVYTWTGGTDIPQTRAPWVRSLRYDSRTGKDSSQTYDTAGPLSVNMATGNLVTGASGHSSSALGGSLGVSMDYDSPYRSRSGLTAEYWNQSGSTFPTTPPAVTRVETNVDYNWNDTSPHPGIVTKDNFMARWSGYFVAPTTGNYQFGAKADDRCRIKIDNQVVTDAWTSCNNGTFVYGSSVSLTAGQVVPIAIEYAEATGNQDIQVKVKGAVTEQILPSTWLQTGAKPITSHGLTGHYFEDKNNHVFPTNENDAFLVRTDAQLSMRWDAGSPVASGPLNDFMARWTGYLTAPTTGSYTFGAMSDDGVRIKINDNTTYEKWQNSPSEVGFGTSVNLTAGQTVPIVVEYFDHQGGAAIDLLYKLDGSNEQIVPSAWLSPKAQPLPVGWTLGVDADGNLGYDRLKISQSSAVLTDSTGETHEYKWNNSGYTPPAGEDGQLIRNLDGTFTMLEADGRSYIFDQSGKLTASTIPLDDKKPAALKYEYTGSPSRLTKIVDGVTSDRFMSMHYSGDSECSGAPSGFDNAAPAGMLCAIKTNDGRKTNLWYKTGLLSRMSEPGGEHTDWGYDTLGRIVQVREPLANDVVAASVRTQDDSVTTQVTYDVLGRVATATIPAPTAGANRSTHSYEYVPGSTKLHVSGATESNGFSRKITYDATLRTVTDTDIANLTDTTEWDAVKDMVLSTTDETGLKSTTIYDDEDRPTSNYGPAPSSWYGSDRKPLTAHASAMPRTDTAYDQNMVGPAITWYNTRRNSNNQPYFYGPPKGRSTNFPGQSNGHMYADFRTVAPPVTVDSGNDSWGYSATGKLRFPGSGTYTFNLWHDDGVRVWVDDQMIIDDWTYANDTQKQATGHFTAQAGKPYRFRFDFANKSNNHLQDMWMAGAGITDQSGTGLGSRYWTFLTPDYSLTTSTTAFDSTVGNLEARTNFGSAPEMGQPQSTTTDPNGLNLTTTSTFEAQGASGTFMRQTSRTLPGGSTTTNYAHYTATDTRDDPCTTSTTEAYKQAGMLKFKTEADPDGSGSQTGRVTETIYDDAGRIVATRYNTDSWTCMSFDSRGRAAETKVPAIGGEAARTTVNNYAVDGNPLITRSSDDQGSITTKVDLLGRVVEYTDTHWNTTTTTYDDLGRMTARSGPLGDEEFVYDNYHRLTSQKLDTQTVANVHYDSVGRLDYVQYPTAGQQKVTFGRDALGRTNNHAYTLGNGATGPTDSVTHSQSGQITGGTENGVSKAYTYDTANRLTQAVIGNTTYSYSFGAVDSSCGTGGGINQNAGKNGNRTSMTKAIAGGATTNTTYCYDHADRLLSSSDGNYTNVQYDTHGNTTSLGNKTGSGNGTPGNTAQTELSYDSSGRVRQLTQNWGEKAVFYQRDAQSRLKTRNVQHNWSMQSQRHYGYTGSGDTADFVRDNSWTIVEKYIQLPGGALLTLRPTEPQANDQKTFSLPNLHGDIFATTNAAGTLISTHLTGPFGEKVASTATPNNTVPGATFAYVGQHEKLTESDLVIEPMQMGARTYIPGLGRFLQVDPVEGGVDNTYVYPTDPVNDFDLAGTFSFKKLVKDAGNWWNSNAVQAVAHQAINVAVSVAASAGVVACVASVVCGVGAAVVGAVALTAVGTGAHYGLAKYGSSNQRYKSKSVGHWAGQSGRSVVTGAVCGRFAGKSCGKALWYGPKKGTYAARYTQKGISSYVKNVWKGIKSRR